MTPKASSKNFICPRSDCGAAFYTGAELASHHKITNGRHRAENEVAAGTVVLPATGARRLQGEDLVALKRRERTERARARFDR